MKKSIMHSVLISSLTALGSVGGMGALVALPILSHAATSTAALPQHWQLDMSHTRIGFAVEHLGYSTTMGRFKDATGNVHYNIKQPNATTMNFKIMTDSIDTGWDARDAHLKTADFFNVEKYPTMQFVSKKVNFINPNQAKVMGDFTMLGQTHPITLDVTLKKIAPSPMTKEPVIGFRATTTIDRTKYGMNTYASAITTQVPIQIDGELNYVKLQ